MSPWPPEGEPEGKGTKAGRRCRGRATPISRACRSTGTPTSATRSSGRRRGTRRCTSRPARSRRRCSREIGIAVAGAALPQAGADPATVDAARAGPRHARRRRRGARANVPPGLGSYARKEDRLDARLAAALMGIQAVKGVEIGDGFALARLRGSEAHDEIVGGERRAAPRDEPRRRHRGRDVERRGDRRARGDEAAADADAAARARSTSRRASRRARSSSAATSRRWRRSPSSRRRRSRGSSRAPRARSSAATPSATSSRRAGLSGQDRLGSAALTFPVCLTPEMSSRACRGTWRSAGLAGRCDEVSRTSRFDTGAWL